MQNKAINAVTVIITVITVLCAITLAGVQVGLYIPAVAEVFSSNGHDEAWSRELVLSGWIELEPQSAGADCAVYVDGVCAAHIRQGKVRVNVRELSLVELECDNGQEACVCITDVSDGLAPEIKGKTVNFTGRKPLTRIFTK